MNRPSFDPAAIASLPRWGFGDPGPLRDELTGLALAGTKTTTASLEVEFELEGETVPEPGGWQVLVDSEERPIAVVETVSYRVARLADVDDQHAIDEGEGYANAAEFRATHEPYWRSYLDTLREQLGDPTFAIDDDTLIGLERFRIVATIDPASGALGPGPAYPAHSGTEAG